MNSFYETFSEEFNRWLPKKFLRGKAEKPQLWTEEDFFIRVMIESHNTEKFSKKFLRRIFRINIAILRDGRIHLKYHPSMINTRILAVPKSSHETQIPGTLGTGTKVVGTVPGF